MAESATESEQVLSNDALLRDVLNQSALATALINEQGLVVYANASFAELLATDPLQLRGDQLLHLYPHHMGSEAYSALRAVQRGKRDRFSGECEYARVDGTRFWVIATASRVGNSDQLTLLQLQDIDEQKKRDAQAAYDAARWDSALAAAGQGVWDHDIRKDDMYYSKTWRTMRGYEESDNIDGALEVWLDRLHPEDRDRISAVVKKQDAGEEGHDTLVYRERHKDGHYVWIWSRGCPIEWDERGTPIRTVGVDTDITHIKEIEAQLAQEKERLRVTLESIDEGVIATDARGQITFMNPAAERMTGWDDHQAKGLAIERVFETTSEDDHSIKTNSVKRALAEWDSCRVEGFTRLARMDGKHFYLRETASPLTAIDGQLSGAVVVFRDATLARQMQHKLEHAAAHDALTELFNRSTFDTEIAKAIDEAGAEGRRNALILIDLDNFKSVNDTCGHLIGDELLRKVARTISANVRGEDVVARIGGDEFAVILRDCPLNNAKTVAELVCEALADIAFDFDGHHFDVSASIGVTDISGSADDPDSVYRRADAATYDSKRNGRGRVSVRTHADASDAKSA